MCGIFGIVYPDSGKTPDDKALQASMRSLSHRGPDAGATYVGPGVGLAHTRLSLIDLDPRSNQPFWDASRRYVLIYNGEIYNFRDLREGLQRRGVAFRTTGDTEVLLQCLIHDGPEKVLPTLGGMFAFGFYDTVEHTLLVARDRFGMKPLYYREGEDFFAISSEVKGFGPWIPFEAEPFSIASYLLGFGGPTKGFTFYKQIKSLAPGTFVTVRRGEVPRHRAFFVLSNFWDRAELDDLESVPPRKMVDRMEELLFESVKRQMFADSRVGAFCSGGVDSSLLVAMAAKMHNNLAIFHANVRGPWSEYQAARRLSKHLKLDLNVVEVEDQDFVTALPDAMRQYEHPYTYHPNCVPFMMVARLARQHQVKGMLSGEGSDELFLGYPWFGRQRIVDLYYALGVRLRKLIHKVPSVGKIMWPHDGNRVQVIEALMNRGEVAEDERGIDVAARALGCDYIDHKQRLSMSYLNYHLRTLLHRNDCLGMEASIEARFPFLDHSFARTAVNMPSRYKLRFSPRVLEKAHPFVRDKWVVREVANRWLPREFSQRIKIGFWTTVFQRMEVSAEYFRDSNLRHFFELTEAQMGDVFEHADQDLRMRFLHLDVWHNTCLLQRPPAESTEKVRKHVTVRPEYGRDPGSGS
jgi:asparagine synthase (glutamine-hydrolysing)